ncbi:MAG: hypothetical protein CEN89_196 [Candidatus Berkelbacteria bacterium Licking1014_7]|uniref:Uncharacterized protein n=1 Tax=Candidatus Berkelbacteria bacterium Licking1014_7 TaxID=2017147 RepID=A0A554LJX9_9BACT|nr:MAG: hypothetical protein CEN89_196 [Candidatus Berkelbacteria bacterium Licking1014_7]
MKLSKKFEFFEMQTGYSLVGKASGWGSEDRRFESGYPEFTERRSPARLWREPILSENPIQFWKIVLL